jgi:LacI family transcriptional regulator
MRDLVRGIKRLEKPVGLVTWNMAYAREIVQACQQAKVSVPEDVAVVSWDDDALLAENMEPTITGCVLPAERLGYEAARLLDRLLRGQEPPAKAILVEPPGILHIRQSSNLTSIPDREVNLALQYMREHAAKSYRIPALLKVLRVSRSKLERDFLRVTGTTLNEAIIASHLTRAKQLLLETDWPLHLVAEYSGFGSKQHFHRTFVQIVKVTPGQYRDQFGKT